MGYLGSCVCAFGVPFHQETAPEQTNTQMELPKWPMNSFLGGSQKRIPLHGIRFLAASLKNHPPFCQAKFQHGFNAQLRRVRHAKGNKGPRRAKDHHFSRVRRRLQVPNLRSHESSACTWPLSAAKWSGVNLSRFSLSLAALACTNARTTSAGLEQTAGLWLHFRDPSPFLVLFE